MRSHLRTVAVLAVAAALVGLFLHNVDLWGVAREVMHARPQWLALSGDKDQKYLYVADGHNERVHVLDRHTLEEVFSFGAPGNYPGQFSNIHVIASDSKGNVYVGDGGGRFQKFVYKGMSK